MSTGDVSFDAEFEVFSPHPEHARAWPMPARRQVLWPLRQRHDHGGDRRAQSVGMDPLLSDQALALVKRESVTPELTAHALGDVGLARVAAGKRQRSA